MGFAFIWCAGFFFSSPPLCARFLRAQVSVAKLLCKSLLMIDDQVDSCQKVVNRKHRVWSLQKISEMYQGVTVSKSDVGV